jgi:low temperature requirement protein LtrA
MVRTLIYIAIILALAAAVALLPGGGTAAGAVGTALSIAFLGTLVWFAARVYRENRMALMALDERWRALLYVAIGVVVVTLAATSRLWLTSAGVIAWFALLFAAAYALYATWRHSREY